VLSVKPAASLETDVDSNEKPTTSIESKEEVLKTPAEPSPPEPPVKKVKIKIKKNKSLAAAAEVSSKGQGQKETNSQLLPDEHNQINEEREITLKLSQPEMTKFDLDKLDSSSKPSENRDQFVERNENNSQPNSDVKIVTSAQENNNKTTSTQNIPENCSLESATKPEKEDLPKTRSESPENFALNMEESDTPDPVETKQTSSKEPEFNVKIELNKHNGISHPENDQKSEPQKIEKEIGQGTNEKFIETDTEMNNTTTFGPSHDEPSKEIVPSVEAFNRQRESTNNSETKPTIDEEKHPQNTSSVDHSLYKIQDEKSSHEKREEEIEDGNVQIPQVRLLKSPQPKMKNKPKRKQGHQPQLPQQQQPQQQPNPHHERVAVEITPFTFNAAPEGKPYRIVKVKPRFYNYNVKYVLAKRHHYFLPVDNFNIFK